MWVKVLFAQHLPHSLFKVTMAAIKDTSAIKKHVGTLVVLINTGSVNVSVTQSLIHKICFGLSCHCIVPFHGEKKCFVCYTKLD